MLKQLQKRKEEGFTIIEVMIVLAIAGLIILVVLLAIPALQRNSRNTTIKNDAAAVAGAIQEFQSANNGKMPDDVSVADGTVTVSKTGLTSVTGKVKAGTDVVKATIGAEGENAWGTDKLGVIGVTFERKCNSDGTAVAPGVNKRSVAIVYNVETSSSAAPNCLDA